MRLSVAAGILGFSFPSHSQFAGAERKFDLQERYGNALGVDRFGRLLGKQNRKISGSSSYVFAGERDKNNNGGEPIALLKNGIMSQQRTIKQRECDPVADNGVDVGLLACGMGYYCQESEDSTLGGICVANTSNTRIIEASERSLQAGFQAYCSQTLCSCEDYNFANNTGLITCGPIHYCHDACDPNLCIAGSTNVYVYDEENFVSFECREYTGGSYVVKTCQNAFGFAVIYVDGVACDYAAKFPDLNAGPDEYCYTFDCRNTIKNATGSTCASAQLLPPQFYEPCAAYLQANGTVFQCEVCGENSTYISLPETMVNGTTCFEAELKGRAGIVSMDECSTLTPLVQENCGCLFSVVPTNDLCSDAIPLTIEGDVVNGTIRSATADPVEACVPGIIQNGVWYTLTGTGVQTAVSLCGEGTDFDTQILVFEGSCDEFACIGGNDDDPDDPACGLASSLTWFAETGKTYYVLVFSATSAVGEFGIRTFETEVPPTPAPVAESGSCDYLAAESALVCSVQSSFSTGNLSSTVSGDLSCPVTSLDPAEYIQASQEGRCECTTSLIVNGLEEPIDCECYVCPQDTSVLDLALQCQDPIISNCTAFSCDGTCNGEISFIEDNPVEPIVCAALTNETACNATTSDEPSTCHWCGQVCRNSAAQCPGGPPVSNACASIQNETECTEGCFWCVDGNLCQNSEQECPGKGGENRCQDLVEVDCTTDECQWCPDLGTQGVCTSARTGQCPESGEIGGNNTVCTALADLGNCTSNLDCRWCEDNPQCKDASAVCDDGSLGVRGNPCEDGTTEDTCPSGCLWCLATSECKKPSNQACAIDGGNSTDPCRSLNAAPDCEGDVTCQWCDVQSTCKAVAANCGDPSGVVEVELGDAGAKFAVQDDGLGSTDPNAVSVSLRYAFEIAEDGSDVLGSFVDFEYQQFEVTETIGAFFADSTLTSRKMTLTTTIAGVGTAALEIYTMLQGGTITSDAGESWSVEAGDVKFNILLSDWTFCDAGNPCGDSEATSEFIDVAMRVEGSLNTPQQNATDLLTYHLGGDVPLILSNQVTVDDFLQGMPAGFPRLESTEGQGAVFVFRFPRFDENVVYDPIIGFHEALVVVETTEAPVTEAPVVAPTEAPAILVQETEAPSALTTKEPSTTTTNAPIETKDIENEDDGGGASIGVIVGSVIGGLVALCCCCAACGVLANRSKDKDDDNIKKVDTIDGFEDEKLSDEDNQASNVVVGSGGGYGEDDDKEQESDEDDDDEESDEDDDDEDKSEDDDDESYEDDDDEDGSDDDDDEDESDDDEYESDEESE